MNERLRVYSMISEKHDGSLNGLLEAGHQNTTIDMDGSELGYAS